MSDPTVIARAPMATPIAALRARIEATSAWTLGGAAAIATASALLGTLATGPLGDVALGVGAVGAAVLGALTVRHQRRIAALPLEISGTALVARSPTTRTYRFRARLGRGRGVRDARAEVVREAADGRRIRLLTARLPPLVGPFTVLAVDPSGEDADGTFVVRVSGREGGRHWEAERTFSPADLRPGRFGAGVVRRRGRLVLDPAGWDAVLGEEGS